MTEAALGKQLPDQQGENMPGYVQLYESQRSNPGESAGFMQLHLWIVPGQWGCICLHIASTKFRSGIAVGNHISIASDVSCLSDLMIALCMHACEVQSPDCKSLLVRASKSHPFDADTGGISETRHWRLAQYMHMVGSLLSSHLHVRSMKDGYA